MPKNLVLFIIIIIFDFKNEAKIILVMLKTKNSSVGTSLIAEKTLQQMMEPAQMHKKSALTTHEKKPQETTGAAGITTYLN